MKLNRAAATLIFALTFCVTVSQGRPQDVAARDYFAEDARKVIYIELGTGQRLVFDASDNDKYLLHGKPLEIRAQKIELLGNVIISASPKKGDDNLQKVGVGATGSTGNQGYGDGGGGGTGGDGKLGPTGLSGGDAASAPRIRFFVINVEGSGSIKIDNSGAKGGTGGEGGRGGLGGVGGHGANRDCNNGPGNGGDGGPGGIGGPGGVGGHAGNGGTIEIDRAVCSAIDAKRIIPIVTKGIPGDGGLGGYGGDGGAFGDGGSGGCSGGGANNAGRKIGPSKADVRGKTGPSGPEGVDGVVKCIDCAAKICPLQKRTPNASK